MPSGDGTLVSTLGTIIVWVFFIHCSFEIDNQWCNNEPKMTGQEGNLILLVCVALTNHQKCQYPTPLPHMVLGWGWAGNSGDTLKHCLQSVGLSWCFKVNDVHLLSPLAGIDAVLCAVQLWVGVDGGPWDKPVAKLLDRLVYIYLMYLRGLSQLGLSYIGQSSNHDWNWNISPVEG